MALEYDNSGMGNIQFKSDVSDKISYGEFGAGPNALTSLKNPASGFTPWPQQISYTAFNKVSTIIDTVENNDTIRLDLHYGFDNQRRKTILSKPGSGNKTKYFFGNYEIHTNDTGEKTYLFVNSPVGLCAIIESYEEDQVPVQKVWHTYTDHLGSLVYLENADNSSETLEYSYDCWGNPRKVSDWLDSNPIDDLIADRGYTGHEHLVEFGLINMNGRVYDPRLGRFLSPDPFVQAPHTVGGFNRYTYCYNNPLKYTDPSGYIADPFWIGGFEGAYDRPWPHKKGGRGGDNYQQGIWSKLGAGGNSNPGNNFSDYTSVTGPDGQTTYVLNKDIDQVVSNYIVQNILLQLQGDFYIDVAYKDGSEVRIFFEDAVAEFNIGADIIKTGALQSVLDDGNDASSGGDWTGRAGNILTVTGGTFGALEGTVVNGDRWLGNNGKYYSKNWGGNQYTGSRAGAYKAAGMYKMAGRANVAATVIIGGVAVYNGYQQDGGQLGYNANRAGASATGGLVGAWAGAEAGAAIGAAVGVWFSGIGAVPGAVIGGFVGGIVGSFTGSAVGGAAVDYYYDR